MERTKIASEWFELYHDDLYHFLIYRMGTSDVEDLLQEVFIKAIKGMDKFEHKSNPKTWLFSIARNLAIDEQRKKQRERWKIEKWFQTAAAKPNTDQATDDILQLNEENKTLYNAIQCLKPSYKDAVILRGIKELSISETASILNWNEDKVRNTYHRALKALQIELKGELRDE